MVPSVSAEPARVPQPNVAIAPDCLRLPIASAETYYVAQGFAENDHLGEDWNGNGGGNTDLGDTVYSLGPGVVTFAEDAGSGWGQVVRVAHRLKTATGELSIESVYAHLDRMDVVRGDVLKMDDVVGTIGDAAGHYWAHLHLELRTHPGLPLGPGYAENTSGYVDPRAFIAAHQAGCRAP